MVNDPIPQAPAKKFRGIFTAGELAVAALDEAGRLENGAWQMIKRGSAVVVLDVVPMDKCRSGRKEMLVLTSDGQVVQVIQTMFFNVDEIVSLAIFSVKSRPTVVH